MRRPLLAAALAVTVAAALGACDSEDPSAAPVPVATSTPLAEFATDAVTVAREEFCSRVAPAAVEEALGSAPASSDRWANGERARLAPGVTDVAHEYGCAWRAVDGTAVRAWVFAPPITPGQANRLRREVTKAKGCEPIAEAPRFGARTVAVRCHTAAGVVTAFHGLFGDAWLSCSLEGTGRADEATALDRAGRWCVTVVQAAAA